MSYNIKLLYNDLAFNRLSKHLPSRPDLIKFCIIVSYIIEKKNVK